MELIKLDTALLRCAIPLSQYRISLVPTDTNNLTTSKLGLSFTNFSISLLTLSSLLPPTAMFLTTCLFFPNNFSSNLAAKESPATRNEFDPRFSIHKTLLFRFIKR